MRAVTTLLRLPGQDRTFDAAANLEKDLSTNRFDDALPLTKDDAAKALATASPAVVCRALVSIAFYEQDWRWAQDRCLDALSNANPDVRGLAATCLGHVARVHGTLEKARVLAALTPLLSDPVVAGRVEDALNDISTFA